MKSNKPNGSGGPEERIVALLMGELSPKEASEAQRMMESDPELMAFYNRMTRTIGLVRAAASPASASEEPAPRLSAARRAALLNKFKRPAPLLMPKRPGLHWAVPLALAASVILVLGGLMLPAFNKSRGFAMAQRAPGRLASSERGGEIGKMESFYYGRQSGGMAGEDLAAAPNLTDEKTIRLLRERVDTAMPMSGRSRTLRRKMAPAAEPSVAKPSSAPDAVGGVSDKDGGALGAQDAAPPKADLNLFLAEQDVAANRAGGAEEQGSGYFPSPAAANDEGAYRGAQNKDARASDERLQAAVAGIVLSEIRSSDTEERESLLRRENKAPAGPEANAQERFGVRPDANRPALKPQQAGRARVELDRLGVNDAFEANAPPPTPLASLEAPAKAGASVLDVTLNPSPAPASEPATIAQQEKGMSLAGGGRAIDQALEESAKKTEARFDDGVSELGKQLADNKRHAGIIYSTNAVGFVLVPHAEGIQLLTGDQLDRAANPAQNGIGNVAGKSALMSNASGIDQKAVAGAVLSDVSEQEPLAQSVEAHQDEPALKEAQGQVEADFAKAAVKPPVASPLPEVQTRVNPFSTFSLNVSDVSFKLAAASLEQGQLPEPSSVRSEEFINAFNYHDSPPGVGERVSLAWERARHPLAHNRDLLRLSAQTAAWGREQGRPLNVVLLLDNSGSMERADRVLILREGLQVLARQLTPQDKISVVAFARTARLWIDGMAGGNPEELLRRVGGLNPEGGTNLELAMRLGYETAEKHFIVGGINRVILMTDGAANLGNIKPEALKRRVELERKKNIALDCFGVGWEGFNDELLEQLSRNGDGRYGFLNSPAEAATEFAGQLAGALRVAAGDVKTQIEFNPERVRTYRQIGYERHQLTKEQFRDNTVDAAELGAAESGTALYSIQVDPKGNGPLGVARIRYKIPETGRYEEKEWLLAYSAGAPSLEGAAPSMRLAGVSAMFAEWLSRNPYAAGVSLAELRQYLQGVPEAFPRDERARQLVTMIDQARSVIGDR